MGLGQVGGETPNLRQPAGKSGEGRDFLRTLDNSKSEPKAKATVSRTSPHGLPTPGPSLDARFAGVQSDDLRAALTGSGTSPDPEAAESTETGAETNLDPLEEEADSPEQSQKKRQARVSDDGRNTKGGEANVADGSRLAHNLDPSFEQSEPPTQKSRQHRGQLLNAGFEPGQSGPDASDGRRFGGDSDTVRGQALAPHLTGGLGFEFRTQGHPQGNDGVDAAETDDGADADSDMGDDDGSKPFDPDEMFADLSDFESLTPSLDIPDLIDVDLMLLLGANNTIYRILSGQNLQINAAFEARHGPQPTAWRLGIVFGADQIEIGAEGDLIINGAAMQDGEHLEGAVLKTDSFVTLRASDYEIGFLTDGHAVPSLTIVPQFAEAALPTGVCLLAAEGKVVPDSAMESYAVPWLFDATHVQPTLTPALRVNSDLALEIELLITHRSGLRQSIERIGAQVKTLRAQSEHTGATNGFAWALLSECAKLTSATADIPLRLDDLTRRNTGPQTVETSLKGILQGLRIANESLQTLTTSLHRISQAQGPISAQPMSIEPPGTRPTVGPSDLSAALDDLDMTLQGFAQDLSTISAVIGQDQRQPGP